MAKKYVFKVTLNDVSKPPVWRKIEVPANTTFFKFGCCILAAMGWNGAHLWQFCKKPYTQPIIGIPGEDDWVETKNAKKEKISTIFKNIGDKYAFTYDFGDDWHHTIVLEQIKEATNSDYIVVGAKGKCPPDDVGGPGGYEEFLEQVNDPKNPEYESAREWLCMEDGETWDVNQPNVETGEKIDFDDYMEFYNFKA